MEKNSREFRLGGLSPCGKQDYPLVGNVFAFHSSVIFSHLTHVFFICLLCFSSFFYLFFLFFSVPFIGFPITSQNAREKKTTTKNPKSRPKSVETCLPNKCVCPPVCPTASSPKAQTFEPPLTIHFDVLFAQFVSCHQSCDALHGILFHDWSPPRIKTIFCFCAFTSTVSKMSSWKSPKKCAKFGSQTFCFPTILEKMDGENFARVLFTCIIAG